MTTILRDYQTRAVRQVVDQWGAGHRTVCLVAPTGSGKTVMGAALVGAVLGGAGGGCSDHPGSAVWVAHRRELVAQAVDRLRAEGLVVGAHCPGMRADPAAPVQVGTIQTLLASGARPPASLVVLDEAHHYGLAAEHWATFQAAYGPDTGTRILGLTATPERRDGSPLGDVFTALVVAASYSELLAAGHLAPCVVYAPPPDHAQSGWALDPVTAYQRFAPGTLAFAFFDRVQRATEWERAFCLAGIPARTVHGKTPDSERAEGLDQLRDGRIRVICNVGTMTEGIDIPAVATCILAHCPSHPSGFLQRVGRVLRPWPGKLHALLLDLVDATARHGYPTEDREYSLTGRPGEAITRAAASDVRRCAECMAMYPVALRACPLCGTAPIIAPPPTVRIYDAGLERVYAGADTPPAAMATELERLVGVAERRSLSLGFVVREYRRLFGTDPDLAGVPLEARRREYDRLRATASARGFKPGFVGVRYKALFGTWPPRAWGLEPLRRPEPTRADEEQVPLASWE